MIFTDATDDQDFASFETVTKASEIITNDELVFAITLQGQNSRRDYDLIRQISVSERNFLDQQVIENAAGGRLARVRGKAYLVRLETSLFNTGETQNTEAFNKTGLITSVVHGSQGSFNNQSLSFVFHVCSKIHAVEGATPITKEVF